MSTAVETKGLKRICRECSTRFYDFNKRPIICPHCNAEYVGEVKSKGGRKSRSAAANDDKGQVAKKAAAAVKPGSDEGDEDTEIDDTFVSLEEVETLEDADDDEDFEVDLTLEDDLELVEEDIDEIDEDETVTVEEDEE